MTMEDKHRVEDCKIGVTNLSDHSAVYVTVNLTGRRKNTVCRFNVSLLNNEELVKEIKGDVTRYREENDNGEVIPIILWDALKAVIGGNS